MRAFIVGGMVEAILGVFLIAHGLVHAMYFAPKPENDDPSYPFFFDRSWFGRRAGLAVAERVGAALVLLVVVLFLAAGFAVWGVPGLSDVWRAITAAAAASSLLLFALYWHRWLTIGVLIDVALLAAVLLG